MQSVLQHCSKRQNKNKNKKAPAPQNKKKTLEAMGMFIIKKMVD